MSFRHPSRAARLAALGLVAPLALLAAPHAAYAVGTADGNIPIGTTTIPTSEFGVYGGTTIGTSYMSTAAPTNGLLVQGNVGIGVASPTASLQVGSGQIFAPDGTGSAPGYSFSNAGSTGIANVSGKLRFSMSGQTQIGMDSTNLRLGSGASLTWENNAQALSGTVDTNLSRVSAGVLGVGTGAQGSAAGTLLAGTVGIGTAAPNAAALLDVFSTSKGLLPPRVTSAQEIAIGTNVSSGGLLVYNTTLNELDVYNSATQQWEAVGANAADAAGSTGQVQFNSGGDLGASANFFWNNGSSFLGIGTTSPLSSLSVNGGAAIGSYAGTNAAGSGNLIVSGNVGIGSTAPAQKLTVAGTGLLTGHVAIGNDAAVDQTLLPYGANSPVPSVLRTQDNVSGDLSVNDWMDSISDYSSYTHTGTSSASFYGYDEEPVITSTSTGPFDPFQGGFFTNKGSGAIGSMIGLYIVPDQDGAGNITTGIGVQTGPVLIGSTGNVTNNYGIEIEAPSVSGGGAVTTNYGLYISDQTGGGTHTYNLYSDGASSINYFAGKVGIGTTSPVATLDINGYAHLAKNSSQPIACDAAHDGSLALAHTRRPCECVNSAWTDIVYGTACSW